MRIYTLNWLGQTLLFLIFKLKDTFHKHVTTQGKRV